MFVPNQYREPDDSWPVDLLRRNPLGLLMSNGPEHDRPFATHLPVIPDPEHEAVKLSEMRLYGHMNKANPHWRALQAEERVVVAFTGPNAYISPTIYQTSPAAPTWNFTAVHVHGVLRKLETHKETLAVVKATVCAFEEQFGEGWDMSDSLDYFARILPGVGAFRLDVEHVESMFKLNQEQCPEVQERVRKALARRDSTEHRETAALMDRLT